MDLAGLWQGLQYLERQGVGVGLLVTDSHVQIKSYVKNNKPEVVHEFDVWHMAKGTLY